MATNTRIGRPRYRKVIATLEWEMTGCVRVIGTLGGFGRHNSGGEKLE